MEFREKMTNRTELVLPPMQGVVTEFRSESFPQGQNLITAEKVCYFMGMESHARHSAQSGEFLPVQKGKAAGFFHIIPESGGSFVGSVSEPCQKGRALPFCALSP